MCLLSSLLAAATATASLHLLWLWWGLAASLATAGHQQALLVARLVLGLATTLAAAVACRTTIEVRSLLKLQPSRRRRRWRPTRWRRLEEVRRSRWGAA